MDHALRVRLAQGMCQARNKGRSLICRGWVVWVDKVRQRASLDIGHGDVLLAVDLPDIENRTDVGVIEYGRGARFTVETFLQYWIGLGRQLGDLDRDQTFERSVFGQVDRAHVTLPE